VVVSCLSEISSCCSVDRDLLDRNVPVPSTVLVALSSNRLCDIVLRWIHV
jgi:hypothetical protein